MNDDLGAGELDRDKRNPNLWALTSYYPLTSSSELHRPRSGNMTASILLAHPISRVLIGQELLQVGELVSFTGQRGPGGSSSR